MNYENFNHPQESENETFNSDGTKFKEELTFTEVTVTILKDEIRLLDVAMKKSIEHGDYTTYKNLINGYRETIKLIQELDWRKLHSEYATKDSEGNWVGQVSIWEQNGDGNIRNHKVYILKDVPEKSKEIIDSYK